MNMKINQMKQYDCPVNFRGGVIYTNQYGYSRCGMNIHEYRLCHPIQVNGETKLVDKEGYDENGKYFAEFHYQHIVELDGEIIHVDEEGYDAEGRYVTQAGFYPSKYAYELECQYEAEHALLLQECAERDKN